MNQPPDTSGDSAAAAGRQPEEAAPKEAPPKKKPGPEKEGVAEIGGPDGPEPTRYGDWERKGRCIDF